MDAQTMARMMLEPRFFRDNLRIDGSGKPWKRDDWQEEFLAAMDGGWQRAIGRQCQTGYSRGWSVRPRGHSKSSDAASAVCFALFSARQRIDGAIAAGDRDQAALVGNAVNRIVQHNAWLRPHIEVQRDRIINPKTGSEVSVLTSDAPTSFGLLLDFIVVDEIQTHRSRDLWDSLFSASAKKKDCLLLVLGNCGWVSTWQHELWEAVQDDPRWFTHSLPGPVASWLDPANLAEQKRLLHPLEYQRLWLNTWGSGEGSAFDHDAIEAAITRKGPEHKPRDGWQYFLGADLSARRDWTACCIVGKRVGATRLIQRPRKDREVLPRALQAMAELGMEGAPPLRPQFDEVVQSIKGDGLMRLIDLKLWKPRPGADINLREVGAYILRMHERFGFAQVNIDQWQAVLLRQLLAEADVPVNTVAFTSNSCCDMAATTLAAFNDHRVRLYRHEQLISDLKRCKMKDTPLGIRLEFKRGKDGHGDAATSFFLALLAAKDHNESLGDDFYDGQLIY